METAQQELLLEMNSEFAQELLPVTIFVGVEVVVGFLVNVFVFYMFMFHHEASNYRTFILFLTFIDFVCTVTTMPGEIVGHRFWYMYPSKAMCKTKDFFNVFTVSAETFCLLLISIERKRLVLSEEQRVGRKQALRYCLLSYLIAALLAYPATLFWGTRSYTKDYNNTMVNVTLCEKDASFADTMVPQCYQICVGSILTVLLIVTIMQYMKIAKVTRTLDLAMDNETTSAIRRQTMIFCCITGFFFLTTVLYFTMTSLLGSSKNIVDNLTDNSKVTFFFFLRFYFIHHVMNPFIYGLSNSSVRYYIKTYLCMSCRSSVNMDEYEELN